MGGQGDALVRVARDVALGAEGARVAGAQRRSAPGVARGAPHRDADRGVGSGPAGRDGVRVGGVACRAGGRERSRGRLGRRRTRGGLPRRFVWRVRKALVRPRLLARAPDRGVIEEAGPAYEATHRAEAGTAPAKAGVSQLGIKITRADGWNAWWTLDRCHLTLGDGDSVLVRHDSAPGETLAVAAAGFRAAFMAAQEDRDRRMREAASVFRSAPAARSSARWPLALFAVAGLLVAAAVAAVILFALPWFTRYAASRIPPEWEAKIGDATIEAIAPPEKRCLDAGRLEAVRAILARLASALPPPAPTFQIVIAKDPMVNALAAPGGRIVVFEGLLAAAKGPEEVAGVLAHEISHLSLHHPEQALVRRASLMIALSLVAGDSSG